MCLCGFVSTLPPPLSTSHLSLSIQPLYHTTASQVPNYL